jgi:hypothetical protein
MPSLQRVQSSVLPDDDRPLDSDSLENSSQRSHKRRRASDHSPPPPLPSSSSSAAASAAAAAATGAAWMTGEERLKRQRAHGAGGEEEGEEGVSDESVSHALFVQMMETDQKLFEMMDQQTQGIKLYLLKRSQIMSAIMTSKKFKELRDISRDEPSAEARREARRIVQDQVQLSAAEEKRIKKMMLSSMRVATEVLSKNAPGARTLVEEICNSVANAVEDILVRAGARPREPDLLSKLQRLQEAMGEPEGDTRAAVQAAVFSPPKRGKKKDEEAERFTLASLSQFIRDTNGGKSLIRAAEVDNIMRAIISTQRLEEGMPDIPHFEKTLSERWGIPNIFKMSNGILIINGEAFASAMLQVRSQSS